MTNPTIEMMYQHASVRNYNPDPVPNEMIETMVAAGQRASTSSNMQMFSVLVTTDEGKRTDLMELCGSQKHILQAPVFLAWCADLSRLERICQLQGYDHQSGNMENLILSVVDVAIAMQNAALAAESLGLGFCYIGGIRNNPNEIIKLFDLPKLVFPISGMTLGWPQKAPLTRPRLPLEAVLHWESYQEDDEAYLRDYDQMMIETGIYKGRQVSVAAEQPDTTYGWIEHSARRAAQSLRSHLRATLLDAGFKMN